MPAHCFETQTLDADGNMIADGVVYPRHEVVLNDSKQIKYGEKPEPPDGLDGSRSMVATFLNLDLAIMCARHKGLHDTLSKLDEFVALHPTYVRDMRRYHGCKATGDYLEQYKDAITRFSTFRVDQLRSNDPGNQASGAYKEYINNQLLTAPVTVDV